MSNITERRDKLVKLRKASRITACLLIFGGGVLLVVGLMQLALPGVMNGIVMMASSSLFFVVSRIIENKLNKPSV